MPHPLAFEPDRISDTYDLVRQRCDHRYKERRDEMLTRREAEKVEAELADIENNTNHRRK